MISRPRSRFRFRFRASYLARAMLSIHVHLFDPTVPLTSVDAPTLPDLRFILRVEALVRLIHLTTRHSRLSLRLRSS